MSIKNGSTFWKILVVRSLLRGGFCTTYVVYERNMLKYVFEPFGVGLDGFWEI